MVCPLVSLSAAGEDAWCCQLTLTFRKQRRDFRSSFLIVSCAPGAGYSIVWETVQEWVTWRLVKEFKRTTLNFNVSTCRFQQNDYDFCHTLILWFWRFAIVCLEIEEMLRRLPPSKEKARTTYVFFPCFFKHALHDVVWSGSQSVVGQFGLSRNSICNHSSLLTRHCDIVFAFCFNVSTWHVTTSPHVWTLRW